MKYGVLIWYNLQVKTKAFPVLQEFLARVGSLCVKGEKNFGS